jgi:hypothetical protein
MKDLVENKFWFRMFILVFYLVVDYTDAKYFIPHLRDSCSGALTEQQADRCYHWYYIKEKHNGRNLQKSPQA